MGDVIDRHDDVIGLDALVGAADLTPIGNYRQPGGSRMENQSPLPEEREASHSHPGILVEGEMAFDAKVDPSTDAVKPDRGDVADGNAGHQNPGFGNQTLNVAKVRMDAVAGVGGRSFVDVAIDGKGDEQSDNHHQADSGRVPCLSHRAGRILVEADENSHRPMHEEAVITSPCSDREQPLWLATCLRGSMR